MSERFELRPGARVVGMDGGLGRVQQVLVSPGSGDVSGLVLRRRLLFDRGITIPIEALDWATNDEVRVRLTAAQLSRLLDRHDGGTPPDAAIHEPGPSQARALAAAGAGQTTPAVVGRPVKAGQGVVCRDGEAGSVVLVLLDSATRRATHLVVRPRDLLGRDTMVPIEWVGTITDERIVLDAACGQLEQLPEYRRDEEITADAVSLLWYRSAIDLTDLRHVRVRTRDGVVELSGKTGTERSRLAIETQVRGLRGVLGVRNHLRTFEALSTAARALADPADHRPGPTRPVEPP